MSCKCNDCRCQVEKKERVEYFSSEHVSAGHPDKSTDSIAEAIVDEYVDNDLFCRVAVDGLAKDNKIFLGGEITSSHQVDYEATVKRVLKEIGYTPSRTPMLNYENIEVFANFGKQSADIAQGVDRDQDLLEKGAGDQGIMFGGAVAESPNLICHSHQISKDIARLLHDKVLNNDLAWAKPDIKTQCTIKYVNKVPVAVDTIVVAISHDHGKDLDEIRSEVKDIVSNYLREYNSNLVSKLDIDHIKWHINGTGLFTDYNAIGDSGEVGRKIIVDAYGGYFAHGGGTNNGKDATKVDRSACYMARYAAKHIVATGLASKCQLQVAYCIGVKEPMSIQVDCYGTNKVPEQVIEEAVKNVFDFTPGGIILQFSLHKPYFIRGFRYQDLGMHGHIAPVGVDVPWERVDKSLELLEEVKRIQEQQ